MLTGPGEPISSPPEQIWAFQSFLLRPKLKFQSKIPYAIISVQESRAVARKPRDAAAVLFGLKFADNIYYKFKSS